MVSMPEFLGEGFLLNTETARRLYHDRAAKQPILDYHTHLSAADIAADRRFNDLYEIWLEGDHYKWRAMRAAGVDERYCMGNAAPYEKFQAWATTVPKTLRNPLYHWTHLELRRGFGIDDLLSGRTAAEIWERANRLLTGELTTRAILKNFNVRVVCTTDDPTDDLSAHASLAKAHASGEFEIQVLPTFRPDRALRIDEPEIFLPWLKRLEAASDVEIRTLAGLLDALRTRHTDFLKLGCRASDHGLERCPAKPCTKETAVKIFSKALSRQPISAEESEQYATFLMLFFARINAEAGITMQLHLGARRNVSTKAFRELGPDTGFDAIGDFPQGAALSGFLDQVQREGELPQTVLYNSNPAENHLFATLACSLHSSGKERPQALQWGPPWWFLDQKQGIVAQLNTLSNLGLLSKFIGMTTDSRSLLSYSRHEYFRRILCDLIGGDVERGELPNDPAMLGGLVDDVCYNNAAAYFGLSQRGSGLA